MIAEILITGLEILNGSVNDINSAHIARALEEIGLEVVRHNCVGDDDRRLITIMQEIGRRSDVAVVTGGLGPTSDDITAEAAAGAAGVQLALNNDALKSIEDLFKKRGRLMSPSNKNQAVLPEGSECLYNPVGTAPGFQMKIGRCTFFFLPGVPSEMRHMLADAVIPRIEQKLGASKILKMDRTVSTFGIAESELGEKLADFEDKFPDITLGIRAISPEIHIHLYGRDLNAKNLDRNIKGAFEWVLGKIGDRAFSVDGQSMEALIGDLLRRERATLAVAESCTGGLISHWLTNVPGSSDYFLFSGVAYANDAKTAILGVSPDTLKQYGAVHTETVQEMAVGARRVVNATYGLATSGIAGPDGGTPDKPVGTVCIGLATTDTIEAHQFHFPYGDRLMKKKIFAMAALDVLRRKLQAL